VFVFLCFAVEVCAQEVGSEDVGAANPDVSGALLQVRAKSAVVTRRNDPTVLTGNSFSLPFTTVPFMLPSGHEIVTRGYGEIPGPVLRMEPGNEIEMTLTNELDPSAPNPGCHVGDDVCYLNTTNFHVHGMHVSGMEPQDSVFVEVGPGESYTYKYSLRADHMGGTHIYHPHWHHATSVQTGGGAHGMFIIEDLPGSLPSAVADAPELAIVVSMLNVAELTDNHNAEESGEDALMKLSGEEDACLVNGNMQPTYQIEAGKWTRLRIVYAAIERRLNVFVPDGCEFHLIAKDGIYLDVAPRKVRKLDLVSGNRADVMVKCDVVGLIPVRSTGDHSRRGVAAAPLTAAEFDVSYDAKLLDFDVQASTGEGDSPIQPFKTTRPCYLADLSSADVAFENKHRMGLHPEATELTAEFFGSYKQKGKGGFEKMFYVSFDEVGESWHMSHEAGAERPKAAGVFQLGVVQEWHVFGISIHPLHIHVGSFQIMAGTGNPRGSGNYYEDGDWHDTLMLHVDMAVIRFAPDTYTGDYVVHCHLLRHEDHGMMTYFQAEGTEGTVWEGAEASDPTCYRPENVKAGYEPVATGGNAGRAISASQVTADHSRPRRR